jgi:hypothetical protein
MERNHQPKQHKRIYGREHMESRREFPVAQQQKRALRAAARTVKPEHFFE